MLTKKPTNGPQKRLPKQIYLNVKASQPYPRVALFTSYTNYILMTVIKFPISENTISKIRLVFPLCHRAVTVPEKKKKRTFPFTLPLVPVNFLPFRSVRVKFNSYSFFFWKLVMKIFRSNCLRIFIEIVSHDSFLEISRNWLVLL